MKKTMFLMTVSLLLNGGALAIPSIKMPPGFKIEEWAKAPGARSMTLSANGTLFIGTRDNQVYAIRDANSLQAKHIAKVILTGLDTPNGVAIRDGDLFVAELSRVLRYRNIENTLDHPGKPEVFNESLPSDRHHGAKFIRFAKDGSLVISVGAPCNICLPKKTSGAVFRLSPDGKKKELLAEGVRDSVGFDFHPLTGDLFFSDNGRDMLGDDLPPDELNRLNLAAAPKHFGFPYCHAGEVSDPEFGKKRNCNEFEKPVLKLGPHVAGLGVRFYTGSMFPAEYKNQIFIAEHGSWNRSTPLGYRVSLAWSDDQGKTYSYKIFAEGWLPSKGEVSGRPVDIENLKDGPILVSDDLFGAIYRISYK